VSWNDPPPPPGGPDPYGQQPQQPSYGGPPPPAYGGYPQQPYGYGGYQQPAETESSAVVALVLAISSFVVCPVIPAIVALVLANNADAAIQSSGGRKTGEGLTKAARIVAWINIGLTVGVLVLVIIIAVIAAAAGS
jgi:Domain of unknown function (DUF4190)